MRTGCRNVGHWTAATRNGGIACAGGSMDLATSRKSIRDTGSLSDNSKRRTATFFVEVLYPSYIVSMVLPLS